ncbi:hypothetical protein [Bacillus thuringiensis]|uniref:hypothetical protein n=1 Tax=Bacillus thuringiensis TaxID=1428 RepID=UPI00211D5B29|nr:hypothetical protein [Bacillus thuringiensis]
MESPNKDKTCFIITPIGDDQTDIRRAAEGVIDAVIIPSLVEMGFKNENIDVAHRMSNPGSINKQVITSVLECDLAIVNLTNLNPNVMYELAIRHATRKPVVQICQKGTRLPFDITEERTIFYANDMKGVIELQSNFKSMVDQAIDDEEPDNPIYRVIESNTIMKDVKESDPSKYMLDRMESLEKNFSDLITSLKTSELKKNETVPFYLKGEALKFTFKINIANINKNIKDVLDCIEELNADTNGIITVRLNKGDFMDVFVETKSKQEALNVYSMIIDLPGVTPDTQLKKYI